MDAPEKIQTKKTIIKDLPNVLFQELSKKLPEAPLLVIFYTQETDGYADYFKQRRKAKSENMSIMLVLLKEQCNPQRWFHSWANYKKTARTLESFMAELVQLNYSKEIYFGYNLKTNPMVLDMVSSNYPLGKYVKGFIDTNLGMISIKQVNPIKHAMQSLKNSGIRKFFSPVLLRSFPSFFNWVVYL